jgi:Ca2+-transporting ATPase
MLPEQKGLTTAEVEVKLKKFGPHVLPEKHLPSGFFIFISQLRNPLVYVLILAGIITLILRHFSDTIIIGIAVFVNTILGFFQERKAGKAFAALKALLTPQVEVIRNRVRQKIDLKEVVPGDIIVLSQGIKVPADGKLIFANRFSVNEAI